MPEASSEPIFIGRRIAVVGCSGSGKSTLARRIAAARGIDYVFSDELFWMPGWVQRPWPEFLALLESKVGADAWVMDANLDGRENIVLPRIDTLIWLDYPRPVVMWRMLKRSIRRAWTQEKVFHDNTESLRKNFFSKDSIVRYAWQSYPGTRERYETLWPTIDASITTHRVRSQKQLDALLIQALI